VAEQPQQQYDFLHSSGISSYISISPILPHEELPSCLSLSNLSQDYDDEDGNVENWNEDWDICSVDEMGQVSLLQEYNLPAISEEEFTYYPGSARVSVVSYWSKHEKGEEGALRRARKKLVRRKRGGRRLRLGKWFERVARKLSWRGKYDL
jgi:hypothetical protein